MKASIKRQKKNFRVNKKKYFYNNVLLKIK